MIMRPQDRTSYALDRELLLQKMTKSLVILTDFGLTMLEYCDELSSLQKEAIRIEWLRRKAKVLVP